MDYFIYYLDKNNDNCIYWLYKIYELNIKKIKCGRRYKRYKPLYIVWEHFKTRLEIEEINPLFKDTINRRN